MMTYILCKSDDFFFEVFFFAINLIIYSSSFGAANSRFFDRPPIMSDIKAKVMSVFVNVFVPPPPKKT